ncbi:MAG TPA: hypothetical protein GXZ90_05970 [Clostridiales bacterium]|nr:hypothetical protein [Clostridiales bacterium]
MKEKNFCCIDNFLDDLFNMYGYVNKYDCITIYANADIISEIFRSLAWITYDDEDFEIGQINFDCDGHDYDKEFILSINDDKTIWIQPAWDGCVVTKGCGIVNYIHADCNSKILIELENCKQKVAIFDYGKHE